MDLIGKNENVVSYVRVYRQPYRHNGLLIYCSRYLIVYELSIDLDDGAWYHSSVEVSFNVNIYVAF